MPGLRDAEYGWWLRWATPEEARAAAVAEEWVLYPSDAHGLIPHGVIRVDGRRCIVDPDDDRE